MKLSCWIIYNGFLPGNKFRGYAEMIQDAAIARGHEATLYTNSDIVSFLDQEINIISLKNDLLPDYIVFTDKDIYLAKQLELLHIPVFNCAKAIDISDDKIKTYQMLAAKQIPIPRTVFAPKTFGVRAPFDELFLQSVIEQFGFPLIMKEAFGSFGEQVYFVSNVVELKEQVEKIADRPFMFQQFIETSVGVDLRLQVVGDEVITAMKRTSKTDFRANVTSGGKMETYFPNDAEKALAIRAAKAIGADFAGVDLLFGENNERIVCEVNSNAHIRNLYDCTGVNVAPDIIQYIEKRVGERKQ